MDVWTSVYEPPVLAEIGAFADLTRGVEEGAEDEDFTYYSETTTGP